MAVSLGEINSFRPDANQGTGAPSAVLKDTGLVDNLMKGAQYNAEDKWRKYTTFLNTYKDFIKDVNAVQQLDVMDKDRPYLTSTAKDILSQIAEDPRAFFGAGNTEKLAEINGQLAKLQGDATMSKQDNLFDKANRTFIAQNPDLNTDDNHALIDTFAKNSLGQRHPYTLNLPSSFDPYSLKKEILENPAVKLAFADSKLVGKDGVSAGDEFIQEITGNKYDRQRFLDLWNEGLFSKTDKYGHSIQKAVTERYQKLPDEVKAEYEKNGGVQKFFNDLGEHFFGSDADITEITKDNLQANPNAYKDDELELERQRIAQGWKGLGLREQELNKADKEDILGADSVLKEISSIINKGEPFQIKNASGAKNILKIADPTLLQTFGNIDKDGKVTNVPDDVFYDKKTGQLSLTYYRRNDASAGGNGKIQKNSKGENVVERTVPLDERTWAKTVVKRSFPNKDIGGVNSLVEKIITQAGGSLLDVADYYKGGTSPKKDEVTVVKLKGTEDPSTLEKGKVYELDGVGKVMWNGKNLVKQK